LNRDAVYLRIALGLLLPAALWFVWPFAVPFVLAGVLAIAVYPLKRRIGALGAMAATVAVVGVLVGVAGAALTRELTSAFRSLNERSIEEGGWMALASHALDRVLDWAGGRLPINREAVKSEIMDSVANAAGALAGWAGRAIGSAGSLVVTGLLVALFLYFLLRYGEEWVDRLRAVQPFETERAERLLQVVHDSVVANVYGLVAAAIGQGIALAIGFWMIGLRAPILWGMIGSVASVVPVVGTPLVWVPVLIGLLAQGMWGKAVLLGLWGSLVVGSVDNVLRPLVAGARVKQHPVVVAVAAIGATIAIGPLGVFVGPVLFAVLSAVAAELDGSRESTKNEEKS
jgi:predicted PurR-regulated permease PerM